MARPLHREVAEHDLLEPNMVAQMLAELVTDENGLFSVRGSLGDHCLDEPGQVLTAKRSGDTVDYDVAFEWPDEFGSDQSEPEERRTRDAFMRAGIARPLNLETVMAKLRQIDDVVIGIDTNILLDCTFSAHLLEEIYREQFPNWILVAVPKLVMAEIENRANESIGGGDHPRVGWPTYNGRLGNRGLQELMSLDTKDEDHPGLSLMTVGSLDESAADIAKKGNWLLDSEIRQQFHEFLSEISFHKGTYFLSQDRVNVMMSGTEGAEGLYLQKPEIEHVDSGSVSIDELNRLLYELCVQFGAVEVAQLGEEEVSFRLSIFWPGKQVADWRQSRLRLESIEAPPW